MVWWRRKRKRNNSDKSNAYRVHVFVAISMFKESPPRGLSIGMLRIANQNQITGLIGSDPVRGGTVASNHQ